MVAVLKQLFGFLDRQDKRVPDASAGEASTPAAHHSLFPTAAELAADSIDPVEESGPSAAPAAAVEDFEFNEEWYLAENGDVGKAVAEGFWPNARAHYVHCGRNEGRQPVPPQDWAWPKSPADALGVTAKDDRGVLADDDGTPLKEFYARHNGGGFLTPADLSVTDLVPRRVALLGSCQLHDLMFHEKNPSNCPVDLLIVNNAGQLPDRPSADVAVSDYDFVLIQIPMRSIVPDSMLPRLPYGDLEAFEKAFDQACAMLRLHLECRMAWNVRYGLTAFVANFFVPQRNAMGSLFPKYDLRNPEYFVHRLNEHLESLVRTYKNAYLFDIDRISASVGRRFVQDDILDHTSHGAMVGSWGWNRNRIEPLAPMLSYYDVSWPDYFREAVWGELMSMYRAVRQVDAVKLVVVDLDDTLWNGVSGDIAEVGPDMIAGWPVGVAEALLYLKQRGVLLAIISKNEEQRVRAIWPKIFHNLLSLDDFAAVFINWDPKIENMRGLLEVVNLLPRNVVFIDDNPAERAAMKRQFPDMRILGRHPYYLRRNLLWSSETQVVSLTDESARRTEMVRRQVAREGQRKQLSRADFLREAAPRVTVKTIDSMDHPRFPRVFELVNKTNQFNTTGRRWTTEEFGELPRDDVTIWSFEVEDNFTDYGLVGVVIVRAATIEQWVMSCRVLGYQIEEAVMSRIVASLRERGDRPIVGRLIETDVNFPCRTLFSRCGFTDQGEHWVLEPGQVVQTPDHVRIEGLEKSDAV